MDEAVAEKIRTIVDEKDYISCLVFRLTSSGKEVISSIIKEILSKLNTSFLYEDIFAILMELSFNAIKANYRYLLTLDSYASSISNEEKDIAVKSFVANEKEYEAFFASIDKDYMKARVRGLLELEKEASEIQEKAKKKGRELTEEETDKVKRRLFFLNRALSKNICVHLGISFDNELIILEVINDAPITFKALKNIYTKRTTFKEYVDNNNEEGFYAEQLDTSESAGFGAAMIDARLLRLGLDPLHSFEVIRLGSKTAVTVSLPLKGIKR